MKTTETAVAELSISAAQQVGPHTLALTFASGEEQVIDFGPFLRSAGHPAIRAYLDENRFQQFKIVHGNLNWNNYDLIFSVDDLFNGKVC